MNKCVECAVTLVSPRQVPICENCFQKMMDYKLDNLEAQKEVVTA
ncbi:hypothetical protein [Evansella clarkii]|nr:hypothetical protein [Evansella clarkii]